MDNKTTPPKVYIATNLNNARNEKNYTTKKEVENNLQWQKESAIVELFHIVEIEHLKIYLSTSQKMINIVMLICPRALQW